MRIGPPEITIQDLNIMEDAPNISHVPLLASHVRHYLETEEERQEEAQELIEDAEGWENEAVKLAEALEHTQGKVLEELATLRREFNSFGRDFLSMLGLLEDVNPAEYHALKGDFKGMGRAYRERLEALENNEELLSKSEFEAGKKLLDQAELARNTEPQETEPEKQKDTKNHE